MKIFVVLLIYFVVFLHRWIKLWIYIKGFGKLSIVVRDAIFYLREYILHFLKFLSYWLRSIFHIFLTIFQIESRSFGRNNVPISWRSISKVLIILVKLVVGCILVLLWRSSQYIIYWNILWYFLVLAFILILFLINILLEFLQMRRDICREMLILYKAILIVWFYNFWGFLSRH